MWYSYLETLYFELIWPLQETALARRCILICGASTVDFATANFATTFMTPYVTAMIRWHEGNENFLLRYSGNNSHQQLARLYQSRDQGDQWDELWDVFEATSSGLRRLSVSEPRHRLYGILGLLEPFCGKWLPKPYYKPETPIGRIWMPGTLCLINGFPSLDILCDLYNDDGCFRHRSRLHCSADCSQLLQTLQRQQGPRWYHPWQHDPVQSGWKRPMAHYQQTLPRGKSWDQEATVELETTPLTLEDTLRASGPLDGARLIVKGRILSAVADHSSCPRFLEDMLETRSGFNFTVENDDVFLEMADFLHKWVTIVQGHQISLHALEKTMTFESTPALLTQGRYDLDLLHTDFTKWHHMISEGNIDAGPDEISVVEVTTWMKEVLEGDIAQYHKQLSIDNCLRCLFITESGAIGKTWYATQKDDLVVLLCWSRMPAVLRPVVEDRVDGSKKAGYLLIGFAYLDGFMECAKWDMEEKDLRHFALV